MKNVFKQHKKISHVTRGIFKRMKEKYVIFISVAPGVETLIRN